MPIWHLSDLETVKSRMGQAASAAYTLVEALQYLDAPLECRDDISSRCRAAALVNAVAASAAVLEGFGDRYDATILLALGKRNNSGGDEKKVILNEDDVYLDHYLKPRGIVAARPLGRHRMLYLISGRRLLEAVRELASRQADERRHYMSVDVVRLVNTVYAMVSSALALRGRRSCDRRSPRGVYMCLTTLSL